MTTISDSLGYSLSQWFDLPAAIYYEPKSSECFVCNEKDRFPLYTFDEMLPKVKSWITVNGKQYIFNFSKIYVPGAVTETDIIPAKELYEAGYYNKSHASAVVKFQHQNPSEVLGLLILWYYENKKEE